MENEKWKFSLRIKKVSSGRAQQVFIQDSRIVMTIYRSKSELKSCSYIKCPKFKFLYSPLSLSNYKINFKKIYYKNTMSEHLGSSFNGREKYIVNLEFWSSIHYGSVCRIFSKCPMDKKGNSMEKKNIFSLYQTKKYIWE